MTNSITTYITDVVFAAVTETMDDVPRCEVGQSGEHRCERPAGFFAVIHECGSGLVCVSHLRAFIEQAEYGELVQCNWCSRVFETVDDAVKAMPL